jgi:hypothetical protein
LYLKSIYIISRCAFFQIILLKGPFVFATFATPPLSQRGFVFILLRGKKNAKGTKRPLKNEQRQSIFFGINRLLVKTSYLR